MLSRDALKRMPDDKLIASLRTLVKKQSVLTAELLAHIVEAEERKLHILHSYGSMFKFCVDGLGLPEPMAYKYIGVARAVRKHGAILPMVRAGELYLSTAIVLVPHLTDDNCTELLEAAAGRSKRQVEKLIAERFPKPDVPAHVRKLPQPSQPQQSSQTGGTQIEIPAGPKPEADSSVVDAAEARGGPAEAATTTPEVAASAGKGQPAEQVSGRGNTTGTGSSCGDSSRPEPKPSDGESTGHAAAEPARPPRPRIEPLAPARYKVQFTAGEELVRKLRQAQELLRRQVPDGDPAAICELGLDLLLESLMKKRFATGPRQAAAAQRRGKASRKPGRTADGDGSSTPKDNGASSKPVSQQSQSPQSQSAPSQSAKSQSAAGSDQEATGRRQGAATSRAGGAATTPRASAAAGKRSRYIPAAVRRQVAERDGLQCTYVGPDGNRCESRDVEFHHRKPFARGGEHSVEQVTLRCRAHNAFQAELDYGAEHIAERIRERRARSTQRRAEGDRSARPPADAAR